MNIDGSRIIGSLPVIQPERIGEPGIRFAKCNQIARAGMSEMQFLALLAGQYAAYPGQGRDHFAYARHVSLIVDIKMRHLMIANREATTGKGIQHLAKRARPNREETGSP